MDKAEDELIPLSALQHFLYCPRQCALIHVEQQWAENRYTAEGRVLHNRTETPKSESRRGLRTVTAMPIRSFRLGVFGIADVIELHKDGERHRPFQWNTSEGVLRRTEPMKCSFAHKQWRSKKCLTRKSLRARYTMASSDAARWFCSMLIYGRSPNKRRIKQGR
jgi:hypothetical protein